MSDEILQAIDRSVKAAVKETVNGRFEPTSSTYCLKEINTFMVEARAHMDETKQIMEAFKGVKVLGEGIKWLRDIGLAIAAIFWAAWYLIHKP